MSNNKDFQVNYRLNVQAGDGVEQLKSFTTAVSGLVNVSKDMDGAASSITSMFKTLNKTFGNKSSKKYTLGFNTSTAMTQLEKVLTKLKAIETKAEKITLGFGSAGAMSQKDFNAMMSRYEAEQQAMKSNQGTAKKYANSVSSQASKATSSLIKLNSTISKVTGSMNALSNGSTVTIRTEQSKAKLNQILGLIRQIKREASGSFGMGAIGSGAPRIGAGTSGWGYPNGYQPKGRTNWSTGFRQNGGYVPFTPYTPPRMGGGAPPTPPAPPKGKGGKGGKSGNNGQSAAINRLHYSNMPSWRNLPFAGMLNAYFMYSAVKSELGDAVDFTHTVDAAKQVLLSTDKDLGTFSDRFGSMMANVRKIGVDTRFTMVEMAKATQYMAQAGFDTDQINSAIRPISDLALIADAPIQDIADNITGVLAGYRIDTKSTGALSDQMAATYTRSKATIAEMAESFKMSAGFLQMAGVDISEAIAAFGVLGNANLRGTMAGTSIRSMMTFLAKPSKNAKKTLQSLGVETTEEKDVYGKKVRQLRSLADIFTDLKKAGASLQDMSAIFGKIGGTGAMILASRSDELRELTQVNLHSHGIANKLGQAKQNTTSGLWEQVTSQWSESFTQVFESLEPRIQQVLRELGTKLSSDHFTAGLRKFGEAMLSVFDIASSIGVWFMSNWSWIEPIFITGFAAKSILTVAGSLSNLVVVLKGVGAASTVAGVANTAKGLGSVGANMAGAVNTSRGLTGAVASIGALGAGALVAAGAVAAVGGAAAYAVYSWYQLEKKREALEEELQEHKKYTFPSIEALTSALNKARNAAEATKEATTSLISEATAGERYSNVTADGSWSSQTWKSIKTSMSIWGLNMSQGSGGSMRSQIEAEIRELKRQGKHDEAAIKEADLLIALNGGDDTNDISRANNISKKRALETAATKRQEAWAFFSNNASYAGSVEAAKRLTESMTLGYDAVDRGLYIKGSKGEVLDASKIIDSKDHSEKRTYSYINELADLSKSEKYHTGIIAAGQALASVEASRKIGLGENPQSYLDQFLSYGYELKNGKLVRKELAAGATEAERVKKRSNDLNAQDLVTRLMVTLKNELGDSDGVVSAKILANTQLIPESLLTNKVMGDESATNGSNFSNGSMLSESLDGSGGDFSKAGRNYGGAGKTSTVAPKQVNVTITNLMSIETIKLMDSSEGKDPQIQDLKGSLTQLLLEVVHDFDSSWNA